LNRIDQTDGYPGYFNTLAWFAQGWMRFFGFPSLLSIILEGLGSLSSGRDVNDAPGQWK